MMTDNEIIKALEKQANEKRCIFEQYEEACGMWCKYHNKWCADMSGIDNKQNCAEYTPSSAIRIAKATLDLITRQKAEIERLKAELKKDCQIMKEAIVIVEEAQQENANAIKTAKAEAIKEFAERLKKELWCGTIYPKQTMNIIDNLVKEMVGDV